MLDPSTTVAPDDTQSRATHRTDKAIRIWIVIHGFIVMGWSFASAGDTGDLHFSERIDPVLMYFTLITFLAIPLMAIFNLVLLRIAFERCDRFLAMLWILDSLLIAAQIKYLIPMIQ